MKNENLVFVREASIIVFYDNKGRILLQKRSGNVSKSGEEWGFFGGGIDEGETPEEAIVREIQEELGYKLENYKLVGHYDNIYYNQKSKRNVKVCRTIFAALANKEILGLEVLEGDAMRLFASDEVKKLKLIPGDEKVIEKFEEFISKSN